VCHILSKVESSRRKKKRGGINWINVLDRKRISDHLSSLWFREQAFLIVLLHGLCWQHKDKLVSSYQPNILSCGVNWGKVIIEQEWNFTRD
jgi:hypothetical protein